jgi:hypothetical protein
MSIKELSRNESPRSLDSGLRALVGRALSSVEFVQDYIQFRFDGPCVSTYTLPSVESPDHQRLQSGERGYRDALCDRIGSEVKAAGLQDQEVFVLFSDGMALRVSLCEADYQGPEALQYILDSENIWVV